MTGRRITTRPITACNVCGDTRQVPVGHGPDFEYRSCDNEFEFVECPSCGLAYLKDQPTADMLDVIYGDDYIPHKFNEHLGGFIAGLRRRVQAKKVAPLAGRLGDGAVIADVGPGNGEFLSLIKSAGRAGWRLYGIDFSDHAIDAVERIGAIGVKARFESVDWQGPPIDAITMNQVIEHLDDPRAAVAKSFELLRPGGILFLETPSTDGWDYHLFKQRHWGGWHTPRHFFLFNAANLSRLVESQGFVVEEVCHLLSPNFWLQSVHHRLMDRGSERLAKLFDVSVLPSLIAASALDVIQNGVRRRTSNFRLIARKPGCTSPQ